MTHRHFTARTATASAGGQCVTVASDADGVHVTHSKRPDAAPITFTPDEWRAFSVGVKLGEFDV